MKKLYLHLKKIKGQITEEVSNGKQSYNNIEEILNDNNDQIFDLLEDEQIKTEFEFYHKLRQYPCTNLGLISLIQNPNSTESDIIIATELLRVNINEELKYIDKTIETYKFFD